MSHHRQRCCCLRGDSFLASGEAKLFRGCCLDSNAADIDSGKLGDAGAHGVTMLANLWALADQCQVKMQDGRPVFGATRCREVQKLCAVGIFPTVIRRREVRSDVAIGKGAENRITQRMQANIAIRMRGQATIMWNVDSAKAHRPVAIAKSVHVIAIACADINRWRGGWHGRVSLGI